MRVGLIAVAWSVLSGASSDLVLSGTVLMRRCGEAHTENAEMTRRQTAEDTSVRATLLLFY